ncbi:MAG: metal-dependent hydrolase [Synergistaceae bacterium]|nr:metal-dependent hydrolase [Synergistaceae bacterium]
MPKLRFLGHSAFYIEGDGLKGLIDPFLTGNPQAAAKAGDFTDINAIFLTHTHGDHLGDTVEIAKRTGATVFTCNETAGWLASKGVKTEGMHIGGRAKFSFGTVKLTPAWHGDPIIEDGQIRYGGIACGFVIEVEGKKIYHAGDTGLTTEMKLLEAENIDVACLPIGGYFTMDITDAARAVGFIHPVRAVPMHYNTFPKIAAAPEDFAMAVSQANLLGTEIVILNPGENLEF